jgi:hypothetical protein
MELVMTVEPAVSSATWNLGSNRIPFALRGREWQMAGLITGAGEYDIEVAAPGLQRSVSLVRGAVRLETDQPPEIEFLTADRNRLVNVGSIVRLELQASDDYGVRAIEITARTPDQDQALRVLKAWTYLGPPGNKGPFRETYALEIDPQFFKPDNAYLIEALAADFRPGAPPAKSRPIMLRIKSLETYAPPADDLLARGYARLRDTIYAQERSLNRTANLKTYLEEAIQTRTVPERAKEISARQADAVRYGTQAMNEFRKPAEGKLYAAALAPLVQGEMPWVLGDVQRIATNQAPGKLAVQLAAVEERQTRILSELQALLGRIADSKQKVTMTNRLGKDLENPPVITPEQMGKDLQEDLKKFVAEQERILERSKSLLDKRGEDLTDKEEKILGDLAREEAKWAKYFEEKLTDWSKLPPQDFADGKTVKELNEVFQEIKMASSNLWGKKVEMAVPQEQSGLESAKELEQNLERWLPDTPDRTKWNMEEANAPADIPMAELPSELEDIVGELIDKEDDMTPEVEDVTSPWMDSIDKGAGWGASDGPISSMSAKGVTGNQLPNQMEIGGRSGEGRNGRSSGQMVEESAEGKGGRETPTRLTPSPFEPGSVKDADTSSKGGATGGGKLSGSGAEGLRGPNAPLTSQKLPRLADTQAKIRQQAESLALKLRGYKLPTGDLEVSIGAMKKLEQSARQGDGIGVRRAFSQAVNALGDTKKAVRQETGLHREQVKLPDWYRDEIKTGLTDGVPKGYEEMVGEYFKVLAEQTAGEKKRP